MPFYKKACTFYDAMATRAVNNGHVIDIFACSLDQVGVAEMKVCALALVCVCLAELL